MKMDLNIKVLILIVVLFLGCDKDSKKNKIDTTEPLYKLNNIDRDGTVVKDVN